ncbi:hypothetical protein BDV12DRAFT_202115 [Aspergillus spectabilis]
MLLQSLTDYVSQHYIALFGILALFSITAKCLQKLYLDPLARFPGPKLAAVSRLPTIYHSFKGDIVDWINEQHTIHGNTVRVAPNELSYSAPGAWKDIYGHAHASKKSTEKDPQFYGPSFNGAGDIIRALGPDHARFRRNFSHAFSERALRDQQPLIQHYTDMLVDRLRILALKNPEGPIEMVRLYNLTTFDIMGDLTFGESLDLLSGTGDDTWVSAIFSSLKANSLRRLGRYYPWTAILFQKLMPNSLKEQDMGHCKSCVERVDRRIDPTRDIQNHKPDIWGIVMAQKEALRLSKAEMYANSQIFMVAGTETTATALSGLTYHLLMNREKLDKLVIEIRGAFRDDGDIEPGALNRLKYLNACIEEGLRIYPPVPIGMPRVAPSEGLLVCGDLIPGKTTLSVNQWATYHDAKNFKRPNEFIPERWISDEFTSDNKAALQPFSFGPRNCLGKNLAYSELRMILAKVLYNFDLSLLPESVGWDKQKTFTLWEKPTLVVRLKAKAEAA